MSLDEKITLIANELKYDNRVAYRILNDTKKEIKTLRREVERLKNFEIAISKLGLAT